MTKRVEKVTIIATSLFLTFNAKLFGINETHNIELNEIIICGDNGEDIPIIY